MRMRILPVAALVTAFALPAIAAPSSSSQSSPAPGATTQSNTTSQTPKVAARLSQSLTQAGFTDVHVMPESFLVRAKDRDGNPVMMVINPDSMTAVTAMGGSSNGTGTSNGGNSSSGGATSAAPNSTTHQ